MILFFSVCFFVLVRALKNNNDNSDDSNNNKPNYDLVKDAMLPTECERALTKHNENIVCEWKIALIFTLENYCNEEK